MLGKNYSAKTVDEYIATAPKEAQAKLREVRAVVKKTVPKAEEGISWGMPFYKYRGVLAGFCALNGYVSFGFAPSLDSKLRQALETKGYKTGGKTIQIRFNQQVPAPAIRQILKDQVKFNEARKTA